MHRSRSRNDNPQLIGCLEIGYAAGDYDVQERNLVQFTLRSKRMTNDELSARYHAIEAGLAAWGISCLYVDGGGLLFERAGYPLLVSDIDLL
jgi:hypothetical protein